MRLGLLGPAEGDLARLYQAARFLFEQGVERAVYLGKDAALDLVVEAWATELVGRNPADEALWERAAARCLNAGPEQIREFISAELKRRELARFEVLPGQGARSVELLGGKVVVMIFDKAELDEEDMLPASVMAFGKSPELLLKQIGPRWFVSPGQHGALILDDSDGEIQLTAYSGGLARVAEQCLTATSNTRMRVQGSAP